MPESVLQGVAPLGDVPKGQRAAFGKPQRNVQIPKPHVAVDAQNPFSFFCKSSGEGGAEGGFSRSALPGHNREEFTHAPSPPMPEYNTIIKGFFTKSKRNFALLEMVFITMNKNIFPPPPFWLRGTQNMSRRHKKGLHPKKRWYIIVDENTGICPDIGGNVPCSMQ